MKVWDDREAPVWEGPVLRPDVALATELHRSWLRGMHDEGFKLFITGTAWWILDPPRVEYRRDIPKGMTRTLRDLLGLTNDD